MGNKVPPKSPPTFNEISPVIKIWTKPLVRTFQTRRGLSGALHFGCAATKRFDDPSGKFGVCYLGVDAFASFVECFARDKDYPAVNSRRLPGSSLAMVQVLDELRLFDVRGQSLIRYGETAKLAASNTHDHSMQFSKMVYNHPSCSDGILYLARHDSQRQCIALYERAKAKIRVASSSPWLRFPQLPQILEHYDLGLIDG